MLLEYGHTSAHLAPNKTFPRRAPLMSNSPYMAMSPPLIFLLFFFWRRVDDLCAGWLWLQPATKVTTAEKVSLGRCFPRRMHNPLLRRPASQSSSALGRSRFITVDVINSSPQGEKNFLPAAPPLSARSQPSAISSSPTRRRPRGAFRPTAAAVGGHNSEDKRRRERREKAGGGGRLMMVIREQEGDRSALALAGGRLRRRPPLTSHYTAEAQGERAAAEEHGEHVYARR